MNDLAELRDRLQPTLDELRGRWEALPPERQRQLRAGGLGGGLLLLVLLVVTPLASGRLQARADLARAREAWQDMRGMEAEVIRLGLGGKAEPVAQPGGDAPSLVSVVGKLAQNLEIGDQVQSMRPGTTGRGKEQRESVEVQLDDLVMDELVRFMFQLENGEPPLHIVRLELNRDLKTPNRLRAVIEVGR